MTATNPFADVLNNPSLYAETFLRVLNKKKEHVTFKHNRAQRHYLENRTKRDIILKARQMGFSTMLQGELFRKATTSTCTTLTLTHVDTTTQALRRMSDRFYQNFPEPFPKPLRTYANAGVTMYTETESECMIATAGSRGVGRGVTGSDMHLSEVAFWPDAETVMVGLLQSVPENGSIVVESTPNGQTGWFYDRCMEALQGEGTWALHFYAWWWDDGYQLPLADGETLTYSAEERRLVDREGLTPEQIKWRRGKQHELKDKFQQEYAEDPISCFLVSGNSYFGDLSGCFIDLFEIDPVPDHRYVGGLDFAQANDYTCLIIIDTVTSCMVDVLHINRMSWADQRAEITRLARKWNNAVIVAESNSIGSVNIEQLASDGVRINSFVTTAQSKPPLIQGLKYALTENLLRLQSHAMLRYELQAFISRQTANGAWVYEAQNGAHDDMVMALALAWYGCAAPTWRAVLA